MLVTTHECRLLRFQRTGTTARRFRRTTHAHWHEPPLARCCTEARAAIIGTHAGSVVAFAARRRSHLVEGRDPSAIWGAETKMQGRLPIGRNRPLALLRQPIERGEMLAGRCGTVDLDGTVA